MTENHVKSQKYDSGKDKAKFLIPKIISSANCTIMDFRISGIKAANTS
jgi:hypothetical protein